MKSISLIPVLFLIIFVLTGCKKETTEQDTKIVRELGENDPTILIQTNKNQYFTNETINFSVSNQLDLPVNYFKCDNVDLSPVQILIYTNGGWMEKEIPYVCTAMGPSGYFGVLNVDQTKNNSISLPNINGLIKLQYKFRLGEYYNTYNSNEFTIRGGEN